MWKPTPNKAPAKKKNSQTDPRVLINIDHKQVVTGAFLLEAKKRIGGTNGDMLAMFGLSSGNQYADQISDPNRPIDLPSTALLLRWHLSHMDEKAPLFIDLYHRLQTLPVDSSEIAFETVFQRRWQTLATYIETPMKKMIKPVAAIVEVASKLIDEELIEFWETGLSSMPYQRAAIQEERKKEGSLRNHSPGYKPEQIEKMIADGRFKTIKK